ncbi:MAG TPA: GNAT family N-acetyltransferase [Micropepsaceae bacterium]|nr:GNAT family N-acetyltransferase [Micropepsaceae bacterium]
MKNSDPIGLVIARAGMEAVPETDVLIREAADWLIAKGEPLWGPNETSYDELVRVARAGELVTARIGSELAACMYLHNEDSLFWPEATPGEAFYIHRLAVARKYAGRGYAQRMLAWAETETHRQHRRYLRLDCEPREKLLALYRTAGFARIDAAPIPVGEHFVVRHEKPILPSRTW